MGYCLGRSVPKFGALFIRHGGCAAVYGVSDTGRAKEAIWTNTIAILPVSLLFFGVGTTLFVFYAHHPERLDPTFKTDAIFPLFIARELPVGLAGLVVAGVFAAAQPTISTSMNSMTTALVTDFVRPFGRVRSERDYLRLVRVLVGAVGLYLVQRFADMHVLLYALVGISTCCVFGYFASLFLGLVFPSSPEPIAGLTLHTLREPTAAEKEAEKTTSLE